MAVISGPRQAIAVASALGLVLTAAACGGGGDDDNAAATGDCSVYDAYKHEGTEVSMYASIRDTEADLLEQSWAEFTECTGITIKYEAAVSSRRSCRCAWTAATPRTSPSSRSLA